MIGQSKQLAIFAALLVATLVAWYIFKDGLGLIVFLALSLIAFVQLIRVVLGSGNKKTLSVWWSVLKDAFWGIG